MQIAAGELEALALTARGCSGMVHRLVEYIDAEAAEAHELDADILIVNLEPSIGPQQAAAGIDDSHALADAFEYRGGGAAQGLAIHVQVVARRTNDHTAYRAVKHFFGCGGAVHLDHIENRLESLHLAGFERDSSLENHQPGPDRSHNWIVICHLCEQAY